MDTQEKIAELDIEQRKLDIASIKDNRERAIKNEIIYDKCVQFKEARKNISTIISIVNLGMDDYSNEEPTIKEIAELILNGIKENLKILQGISSLIPSEEPKKELELGAFSLSAETLKNALDDTNILDVVRKARKNGWDVRINEDEVAVYKDGKRITTQEKNEEVFVSSDGQKAPVQGN